MADQTTPAPEAHASDGHGEGQQSVRATYITVFLILGLLTIFEVFVPSVYGAEWDTTLKMLLLCLLAAAKAMFVAWYFMHLKWERPWLRWIALMPLYMAVFVIVIMLETVYR
jgi:caa(3)-type oxidase subunit IV